VSAVLAAARAVVARRRLQTVIVGLVVLLSAATGVLALSLIAASHGPFDAAFAKADGAHAAVTFSADVSAERLAATANASGVTGAAGPFDQVSAEVEGSLMVRPGGVVIAGWSTADGPVDKLVLDNGTWITGTGQIVLSRRITGPMVTLGDTVTVSGVTLRVVGVAVSVTGTADAWVSPNQADVLGGEHKSRQMLYRFASHDSDAAVRAAATTATAGVPTDAVTGVTTYQSVRLAVNRSIAAFVPFIVAFAVLGIVLSVLITVNVVNAAVVSGYRRIGVLKSLGFTPKQVVAMHVVQALGPAIIGALAGVALGAVLAIPLLAETNTVYGLPQSEGVPPWVMVVVAIGAPLLVAVAAVGPAARAGRLAANEAISVGRAPHAGRGLRLRRALAASRLPRSVALGVGMPLARPSRAAGTVVAVLLGVVTLVFAVGLVGSLERIEEAFTRVTTVPVEIGMPVLGGNGGGNQPVAGEPGGPGGPPAITNPAEPADVVAAALATTGGRNAVLVREHNGRVGGIDDARIRGYVGDGSWTGLQMISGRWYANPGEVAVSSTMIRQGGARVGDPLLLPDGRRVTVVGEYLDGGNSASVSGDASLVTEPDFLRIQVGLAPGTDVTAYVKALQEKYPENTGVHVEDRAADEDSTTFVILKGLIATLTLLLCSVAALGVLNSVVLTTRERVQEIGVLKALGMTPRQTRTMVISSMIGLGLLAGVVAVPLGVALHGWVLPVMGDAAGTAFPKSILDVYGVALLVLLGSGGIAIAVLGSLLPAGWAAGTRVATALRAE
jgi:putative ABC transport system permease protein